MAELGACPICASTQYFEDSGMYFCVTCNTALTDVSQFLDQSIYIFDDKAAVEEVSPAVGQKKTKVVNKKRFLEFTSWEVYNYALKGWVDELINIGVDPELKTVALQIWAKYLSLSKVAFFSTEKGEKPRLGVKSSKTDANILYGIKDIQKDLFGIPYKNTLLRRSLNKETKIESKTTRKRKLNKDLLNITKIEQKEALLEASQMSTTLDSLRLDEQKKEEETVNLNRVAKKALDDAINGETEVRKRLKDEALYLNFSTLIAVLRVSLIVVDVDLLVSDLFRLANENVLSLFNIEKVVPSNVLDMCDPSLYRYHQHRPTPDSVSGSAMQLLRLLNIRYRPNLEQVCSRYCKELQLPGSVAVWAQHLMESYCLLDTLFLKKSWSLCRERYDILAVACIIFVLKLLFSLDDVTEKKQSKVAAAINKKIREKNISEPLLFEWDKWQEYITCRKTIVAMHHYPTFLKEHRDTKYDADLLLNYQQKYGFMHDYKKSELIECASTLLKELDPNIQLRAGGELILPDIELRPSMLPLSGYLEQLLTEHQDRIPAAVLTQLQRDFTSTSLKYLMDDSYLGRLSKTCGLEVFVTQRMDELLSVQKINEVQKLDNPLTDKHGGTIQGDHLNAFFIPGKSTEQVIVPNSENPLDLPPVAFELLQKRLYACNIHLIDSPLRKKKKEDPEILEKNKRSNCHKKSKKSLVINKMSSKYWISHIKPWNENVGFLVEFDILFSKLFPTSFVWLLKECSVLLNCMPNDLYRNFCAVESVILDTSPVCDNSS